VACFGTLALGAALLFALMIAVDPYDSGRFGLLGIEGVDDANSRTANASRARDPQFDSAVIGDSTAMLLNPPELSRKTATHVVKLTGYGLSPHEQLATLDFFIRHHQRFGALVIVTSMPWCTHDTLSTLKDSLPFWLYGRSTLEYAGHLFSWRALEHAAQRGMIGLGLKKRDNADGYIDYEEIWPPGQFRDISVPKELAPTAISESDFFPAVARLDGEIKRLPADAPLVLVMPPTFYTLVPQPGSIAFAENEACAAALKRVVAGRPHSNFIDFRVDTPLTRDPANFADVIHYRAKIARKMEEGIIASIQFGEAAKIDF
jgi:hypothetical protein